MAYRKIDVRVHGDAKFRKLSKPQPCGQWLWIYLLTGPHTSSIPGLCHIGEKALAEALGWSLEAFREAFSELQKSGMVEADWESRVIWIPKAIFYNQPESANVVKSWSNHWDAIPECELKAKAYQHVKGFLEGFSESQCKAFVKACGKPYTSPGQSSKVNQEQEQKQEQKEPPLPPLSQNREALTEVLPPVLPSLPATLPASKPVAEIANAWCFVYRGTVSGERDIYQVGKAFQEWVDKLGLKIEVLRRAVEDPTRDRTEPTWKLKDRIIPKRANQPPPSQSFADRKAESEKIAAELAARLSGEKSTQKASNRCTDSKATAKTQPPKAG